MSEHTLDKAPPSVPVSILPMRGGSHLTPAETAVLKEQLRAMWKYELVHLYSRTVEMTCLEKDPGKQHRLLQKAELMSDEVLIRMAR